MGIFPFGYVRDNINRYPNLDFAGNALGHLDKANRGNLSRLWHDFLYLQKAQKTPTSIFLLLLCFVGMCGICACYHKS